MGGSSTTLEGIKLGGKGSKYLGNESGVLNMYWYTSVLSCEDIIDGSTMYANKRVSKLSS